MKFKLACKPKIATFDSAGEKENEKEIPPTPPYRKSKSKSIYSRAREGILIF